MEHSDRFLEGKMGATIDEIIDSLKRGQGKRVSDLVKMALEEGTNPQTILEEGFLSGMEQVAEKFRKEEVGVPEILSVTFFQAEDGIRD